MSSYFYNDLKLLFKTTGFGGYVKQVEGIINIEPHHGKIIKVFFNKMVHPSLPWEFIPQQDYITVLFYTNNKN